MCSCLCRCNGKCLSLQPKRVALCGHPIDTKGNRKKHLNEKKFFSVDFAVLVVC